MLYRFENLPMGFLETSARELYRVLPGPSLIFLNGHHPEPIFVSLLLHGNEDVGLLAIQSVLKKFIQKNQSLPRALILFVGNVEAARFGARRLEAQQDYNRVWPGTEIETDSEEHLIMQEVWEQVKEIKLFLSLDLHNNTGINPHYACINKLDNEFLHLANLFSRIVVYFLKPAGVQSIAFAALCPSVTVECGRTGDERGVMHAAEFIDACLHLSELPKHPVAKHDIDLFHTVAIVKIPENISFGFGSVDADIRFDEDLDRLNFREISAGTVIAYTDPNKEVHLSVTDEAGLEVENDYFVVENSEIRFAQDMMPSMLTLDERVIRQDCLCYLMKRMNHCNISEQ
ncbi:MAG: M14 family metallopeptidase [Gammaproteobacteria bacterium]|nr:M14 family metallopeptidase [Gammaproteobacteria bacterium]MDH5731104.1 M14 family metallopeptidase [Gammaproteobacteria bacterium]